MSMPNPEAFVRRRQVRRQDVRTSPGFSARSSPSDSRFHDNLNFEGGLYLDAPRAQINRVVDRNVQEGLRLVSSILSDSERFSLEDLEWILTIQADLTVESIDDFIREQFLGQLLLPGAERPEHDLLALPNKNEV